MTLCSPNQNKMASSSTEAEDAPEQFRDLFTQDGVLLKSCIGTSLSELNTVGMLCVSEVSENSQKIKCVMWRPVDLITVESDSADQDWAVVNTIGRRQRTFSGNLTSDYKNSLSRIIQIPLKDLVSFRVTRNNQQMQFSIKSGTWHSTFFFQHGNAEVFVSNLKSHVKTAKSRQDRNTYLVIEQDYDTQALNRSFAELDIFSENTSDVVWNFVSDMKQMPYITTMGAFSKLTNSVFFGGETNGRRETSEEVADLLTKSMSAVEDATTTIKSDEYEVISVKPTLPPRPSLPRGIPLSAEKWEGVAGSEGKVTEVDGVRQLIFRGGVAHSVRKSVWKYLLGYYPWDMTHAQLKQLHLKKTDRYFKMKNQWKTMSDDQESRFADYRERKSLVEKDVARTDRTHPFYAGDNNANLVVLQDILMTYVMYNFDLGYVQGMSDILAPILLLFENEVDSFWCFVGFMDKIASNFDIDQAGMKLQLLQLQQLLAFTHPDLSRHLVQKEAGNMYFCFRWLLVWFKREFTHIDIMRLWEVLWTDLPCANFHLLICIAILDLQKETIIDRDYGFTEVLKHVNDLSLQLDVDQVLSVAEGIYHQVIAAPHLNDQIRVIFGLPLVKASIELTDSSSEASTSHHNGNSEVNGKTLNGGSDLDADTEEVMYQIGLDNMHF